MQVTTRGMAMPTMTMNGDTTAVLDVAAPKHYFIRCDVEWLMLRCVLILYGW